MKKLEMMPVHMAVDKSVKIIGKLKEIEMKDIGSAIGYYLSEPVEVKFDVPPYTKSTVDGYAVRAENVLGATRETPVTLQVVGESSMGKVTTYTLNDGEAQYVPTGGMLPDGANAMVMIEDTDLGKEDVKVYKPTTIGSNMIYKGDDLKTGDTGVKSGVCLTSRHVGLLAALGISSVKVYKKPTVAIIATGDELIQLGDTPTGSQIFDTNTHSLKALCVSYGLEVVYADVVNDDFGAICEKIRVASKKADLLLMSGGSSVGEKDMTVDAVMTLPGAQKIVHGLAFKPGKPTLIVKADDVVVLGLPGHPVSALMVMDTVGRRILDEVWNTNIPKHHRVKGVLTGAVKPADGRDSCQMVTVKKDGHVYKVTPHHGKSGMISWIGHSDGYIVAEHKGGVLPEGTNVTVYLWDNNSKLIEDDWV